MLLKIIFETDLKIYLVITTDVLNVNRKHICSMYKYKV